MLKYYVSRYMDLTRCAEIKTHDSCTECGRDLEGHHVTDFHRGAVWEYRRCAFCQEDHNVSEYALQ